tara:strand:- start:78 stop:302 length:225 start_codon:yes stop_codon:yes gene_type:complete
MSESESTETIEIVRASIKSFSDDVSGWEYDDSATVSYNTVTLVDSLIDAIKKRDARIQNLQLMLGQLMERGPQL